MKDKNKLAMRRGSGVLLHITSLPGPYGIGDLGTMAYQFVDWLVKARQSYWQVLPLHPTSFGDSPYGELSVFAGNHMLIDLEMLRHRGWLTASDMSNAPSFSPDVVDFGLTIGYRTELLARAYQAFKKTATDTEIAQIEAWKTEQGYWLDDYALFMAIKDEQSGRPYFNWPASLARHEPDVLAEFRKSHEDAVNRHIFWQWLFSEQWHQLKTYANQRGIRFIGDIPIYTTSDCSEAWAHRHLFYLDDKGSPTVLSGIPPDYFSSTGQLWGNPIFRWDIHQAEGFDWWIRRLRHMRRLYDFCRIDHFRGFEAYWEVPAGEGTAVKGRWVRGPGQAFFDAVYEGLPDIQLIAEDLGLITPEVEELRDQNDLPGTLILQFAWYPLENIFAPHNHQVNRVVYTGTHDNNTTSGWWSEQCSEEVRSNLTRYIGREVSEPHWELIRLAMLSAAHTCIIPMQDILGLDASARMNTPGVSSGCWAWRMTDEQWQRVDTRRLKQLTGMYARSPK